MCGSFMAPACTEGEPCNSGLSPSTGDQFGGEVICRPSQGAGGGDGGDGKDGGAGGDGKDGGDAGGDAGGDDGTGGDAGGDDVDTSACGDPEWPCCNADQMSFLNTDNPCSKSPNGVCCDGICKEGGCGCAHALLSFMLLSFVHVLFDSFIQRGGDQE